VASVVSICNLALAHLGKAGVISAIDPPDGTREADACAQFYPIARDELLERHTWRFATRRTSLTELDTNPQEALWGFAYARPNLAIRIVSVLLPESTDDTETQKFVEETNDDGSGIIYTNVENAQVRYIWKQEDSVKYTPGFVLALSYRLAQYLAGSLVKDLKVAQALAQAAELAMSQATALDAHTSLTRARDEAVPAHIAARSN